MVLHTATGAVGKDGKTAAAGDANSDRPGVSLGLMRNAGVQVRSEAAFEDEAPGTSRLITSSARVLEFHFFAVMNLSDPPRE